MDERFAEKYRELVLAAHKKMLENWLASLVMLFLLHYVIILFVQTDLPEPVEPAINKCGILVISQVL